MAKKNNYTVLVLIVIAFFVFQNGTTFQGAITGNEAMTRTVPSSVTPSSSFDVTYEVTGGTSPWGASIEDAVSGGCKFPSGSASYKTVILSEDGTKKTITMTAPSSGTCTFTGDYKFGELSTVSFPSASVKVCVKACTRPSNQCTEASAVTDGCGGTCAGSWTVTKKTSVDANCDNSINRNELGVAITGWLGSTFSRADLGIAIQSWSAGG